MILKKNSLIDGLLYRLLYWLHVLKNIRPADWRIALGIFLSMLLDIPLYFFFRNNPLILLGGKIFIPKDNLYFYIRSRTDDLYFVTPRREGIIEDFILNSLQQGDVFIDVGANIGYYSVHAARRVGKTGKVIAVEPIPDTVNILKMNVFLNKLENVEIVDKAAWNSSGKRINISVPSIGCDLRFFGSSSQSTSLRNNYASVNTIALDDLKPALGVNQHVILKIDVEGSEKEVLRGAASILNNISLLYVECQKDNVNSILMQIEKSFLCRIIEVPHCVHLLCRKYSRQ